MVVNVLAVKRLDFASTSGERVRMSKVVYTSDKSRRADDFSGFDVFTVNGDISLFEVCAGASFPAKFDIELEYRPDSKGRPVGYIAGAMPVPASSKSPS